MSSQLEAQPLNVLLVEDNPDDAALLERHLQRNGFILSLNRVETASAMSDALAHSPHPDIVLGDYNLPNFSGPEALQLLKASNLDIPFIMLSGAVSEQTAVDSMRAGAQDYVSKQNLTRLVPAVHRELKEASGRRHKLAAELALRKSEARFHHLVDAMPLGLLLNDHQGRIVFANHAAARLLRYPVEQLATGAITIDSLCTDVLAAQAEGAATAAPFASQCNTSDGAAIDVLIGVALLNPEAEPADRQFATFIADLTLQKRSEEALRQTEKLAVAGRFAASIAHEINNPLEAITNCLYLLSFSNLPDDARTYLELAQGELDRVAQITVQTLRFYRSSTSQDTTDLHELIESVITLLSPRLQNTHIQVVRHFEAGHVLLPQAGEIRQVIVNLVSNAMDAMYNGGRLLLRTAPATHWQSGIHGLSITIADTGTGIDPAMMARIFEPFFSTKGITGTGLGLWISREIITKHHGTISIRSKPASGTVFRIFLPIPAEANHPTALPVRELPPASRQHIN